MRQKNSYGTAVSVLFISLFMIFCLPQQAKGENWVLLGQNDDIAVYLDGDSAKMVSETASTVWTKVMQKSQRYLDSVLQTRRQQGMPIDGYENLAFTLESVEVECSSDRHRILETADYDKNGRKIGASFPISGWIHTEPDTPNASISKAICRQHSESDYWWWDLPQHENHDEQ